MAVTYAQGRVKMTADNDASASDRYLIKSITWTGAANTDTLVLQDQDDFDIWKATAETGHLEMEKVFTEPLPVQQIKAETLDGGEVIVYV